MTILDRLRGGFLRPPPESSARIDRRALGIGLALLLGVALLKWLAAELVLTPWDLLRSPWHFGYEAGHVAGNLARGKGFVITFSRDHVMPTAWVSPAYPLLLSGVFRVLGPWSESAAHAAVALNGLFQGATAALLYWTGRALGGSRVGLLAAGIFFLSPGGWHFLTWAWPSHLFAATLSALMLGLLKLQPGSLARASLCGVLLGLALLVDGAAITLVPVALLAVVAVSAHARLVASLAVLLLTTALVLSPWAIRNASQLGAANPLRGNVGVNLWVGNHPGTYAESFHGIRYSPFHRRSEREQMIARGERDYDRYCLARALEVIAGSPERFVWNTAMRFSGFWLGEWWTGYGHIPAVASAAYLGLFALALVGIVRHRSDGLGAFVLALLLFAVPYALTVHGHGRYRIPIEPVLCLFAALAFTPAASRVSEAD